MVTPPARAISHSLVRRLWRGQMNCDQRGRASRLDVDTGPFQIQEIRDSGGQKVLVVPGSPDRESAHGSIRSGLEIKLYIM